MVDQYSEDANHMEKLKEFDKRLRESKDKSQNLKDYEGIIEFSKMSMETKELGVDLIPRYFPFYTSHSNQAFDAYKDIIEAVDVNITVRVQAIRKLPLFCKDAPEFVSKIIDVLVQCLDIDQQEQHDAVHESFMSLFQQDTLPDLIKKSLGHVSGEEIKMITTFLTSLSKFGVEAAQERMQELLEIVEGQADLDAKLNISDSVDRLVPYLQAALPFIVRGDPDSKFLNFLKKHILSGFDKLPEPRKLDFLKALAEISPHTTILIAPEMLPPIFELLKKYMLARKTVKNLDSRYVECLLYVFHHMAHKVPYATNSLCGYKFATRLPSDRIGDDFSKLYKEFTERLTNLEDLMKASMEQLVQEMSDHDKANLRSKSMSGEEEANLYTNRQETKTKLRTCLNILAMTEVLHAEAPSFIGDTVKLSWKEATKPIAYTRPISYTRPLYPVFYTTPDFDALDNFMGSLPMALLDILADDGFCEVEDVDVQRLVGLSRLKEVLDTLPDSKFGFHDNSEVAFLLWKIRESKLLKLLTLKSWKGSLGYIRDQLYHMLCWAYASSDLVSCARITQNLEVKYLPLCVWYLCAFCRPEKLGKDDSAPESPKRHICYGNSTKDSLLYIKENGIPIEICEEFDCEDWEPPNSDEPQLDKRKIKDVRTIESMEEALLLLPYHAIGANLIVFEELSNVGEGIYYGPGPNSLGFQSYHAVIIAAIELYEGEVVALCKLSNGTKIGDKGYVRVSLATMFLIVAVSPEQRKYIRGTPKPMHLLSNFVIVEIDEKEKEGEKENEKQEDNLEENSEQNPKEKPEENQERNPEEKSEHKPDPDNVAPRSNFHNFLNMQIMPDFDKVMDMKKKEESQSG